MAIPSLSPSVPARDLVTLREGAALLADTEHPASVTTLRRWIELYSIRTERRGRADAVSFSDLLVAQREAARREAEADMP